MPSHFEDLGFKSDTDEDIKTLLKWTIMYGEKIRFLMNAYCENAFSPLC